MENKYPYLGKYNSEYSYVFTQHLLPCGWASWSKKFLKFYDENMENYSDESGRKKAINRFVDKKLARQYSYFWREEYQRAKQNVRPVSWDYQMDFCLKYNDLYGICPTVNQIKNIGIDQDSIHGGIDKKGEMTLRFCEIETFPIKFPLKHPNTVKIDLNFENEIAKILLYPFKLRVKNFFSHRIRKIFNIPGDISVRNYFKGLGRC